MKRVPLPAMLSVATLFPLCLWASGETTPPTVPKDRAEIIHVLNRTTFGIRPGDIEAVQKLGLQNYIEQQLHPETIDDSAMDVQLADYKLLRLSQSDLHKLYRETKKVGKEVRDMQSDSNKGDASMSEAQASASKDGSPMEAKAADQPTKRKGKGARADHAEMATDLMKEEGSYTAAVAELSHAKLIRAISSPRQLQEVLVDFWGNHFNVDVKKGPCIVYKVSDDRDVIRPHIFSRFRDLLGASAKSPAMLFYLDNAKNSAAPADPSPEMQKTPAKPKKRNLGINENYAREIMELHTLGADGGYTQKDVQEVARCFTGWTIDRQSGEFVFQARSHDNGPKTVLGHEIPANGGIKDGEMVMDILCAQPACAQHISRELCQRFVGDNPSPELVARVADVFAKTGGDLRAVTGAILTSPEFLDPSNYGNKIKSPVEFAVSAVRASGAQYVESNDFSTAQGTRRNRESQAILGKGKASDQYAASGQQSLNWHVYTLGQPLFACTPPTGYKEVSDIWVNPGALIERLNFAMALTEQKIQDIRFSPQDVLGKIDLDDPKSVLDQCVSSLLQGSVSDATKKVLTESALPKKGEGQTVNPTKLIALIIGSPEFQRK